MGQDVIPDPSGLPIPELLVLPSMASDMTFIITSIMRNMAPNISALASAVVGTGAESTQSSVRTAYLFFMYVIWSVQ
jgi:hypothetical protein